MPEAAMHEHGNAVAHENEVWTAWQILAVEPKSEAERVRRSPHDYLRTGMFALHARHEP